MVTAMTATTTIADTMTGTIVITVHARRVGNRNPHRNHRLRIVTSPTIPTILTVITPGLRPRLRTKTRMTIPTGPLDAVHVRLRETRTRIIHATVDVRYVCKTGSGCRIH